MNTHRSPQRRKFVLISVIALNLLILTFLGQHMVSTARSVQAEETFGLAWVDPAPKIEGLRSIDGDPVSVVPGEPNATTFLIFFDDAGVEHVRQVFDALEAEDLPEKMIELIAVYDGSATAWRRGGAVFNDRVQIVADAAGRLRRSFEIPADFTGDFTIAVDHEGRIRFHLAAVLPAHLIIDYNERRSQPGSMLATDESPPPVIDRRSPLGSGQSDLQPTSGDGAATGGKRLMRLERVSDRGAGRLELSPGGEIFALSRRHHSIWVLRPDFSERGRIGGFGQGPGELMMPYDLTFDPDGNLLVIERGNQRLQRFDLRGQPLDSLPTKPNASSVAVAADGTLFLANSFSGSLIQRLDDGSQSFRSHIAFNQVPWLRDRVEAGIAPGAERERLLGKFEAGLNESYIRVGPSGRLFVVPVWDPALQVFDHDGRLLHESTFSFDGLDEWSVSFEQALDRLLAEGTAGVLILIQDFALDPTDETIALVVSGSCPSLILATPDGAVTNELCFLDDQGGYFEPGAVCAMGGGRWLVANETGIFTFAE